MPGVQLRPMSRMALVMAFMILSIVDIVNAFAALGCAGTLQRSSTAGVFLGRRAGLADAVSLRGRGGGNSGVAPSMAATDVGSGGAPMLIGHGFDIHRLTAGKDLVIGGVKIPYELGADAHSDGDVIYHSVVDAILGALGLPDIGQLFPDNDPQWSGADSSVFMEEAYRRMDSRGFRVGNVDVTLILQKPKVMDIKPRMRENIVRLLHTSAGRVNVKARTHEKVDAVGEGRAMACHVVVLLEKIP